MSTHLPKVLTGLRWHQAHVRHLACIKTCLDYLGIPISCRWLYGGTGHAFVLNYGKNACPSGPTAWDTSMLFDLAPNLGYRVEGVFAEAKPGEEAVFAQKQREAWDFVRASIDQGLPCYGFQMEVPEFYVIRGYDEVGYLYSDAYGPQDKGPLPWQKLATWDVTVIDVRRVMPCPPPATDDKVVRGALTRALQFAERPAGAGGPHYAFGPAGFTAWAGDLEAGTACREGHAWIADVWLECRSQAVEFLQEANERLHGRCDAAFAEAIDRYAAVCDRFRAIRDLCPQRPGKEDWSALFGSAESAALLREAAEAERRGLDCLRRIAAAL